MVENYDIRIKTFQRYTALRRRPTKCAMESNTKKISISLKLTPKNSSPAPLPLPQINVIF